MSLHAQQYREFCNKVARLDGAHQSLKDDLGSLNAAIIAVHGTRPASASLKLHSLSQRAAEVRRAARAAATRLGRPPDCLGIFHQALIQADLAQAIAAQCYPVAVNALS